MIVEKQLLPRAELKPAYDEVVWLYVYRDFSGSEADLAAERIALRLSFTSYPQHWLLDPSTLARLRSTGRSVPSFLAAARAVSVPAGVDLGPVRAMRDADARAAKLRKGRDPKEALRAVDAKDPVLCYRALEVLAEKAPEEVARRAKVLLGRPNDPIRFLTLSVLGRVGAPEAAEPVKALLARPPESLNPNVLRISAVQALGSCGDGSAVALIRPYATSGDARNGLTGVSIDALAAIAARVPKARPAVIAALSEAWPSPAKDPRFRRAVTGLAKRVHRALVAVTGRKVAFPGAWNEEARAAMRKAFAR